MIRKRRKLDMSKMPKDPPWNVLLGWGDSFRKEEQYSEAEICYSRCIARVEASANEVPLCWLTSTLEKRSSVREKMGRLDEALEDADRILKTQKTNPRAYICLGHLLQVINKPKSAEKCYEFGLTQCSKSDFEYPNLVRARDNLIILRLEQEAIKKMRDPVLMLPTELLYEVFSYLSLRELLKCHRVSKAWRAMATSDPSFYRVVDLPCSPRSFNKENASALIRYAAADIRVLKIFSPQIFVSQSYSATSVNGSNYKNYLNVHLGELFKNLERFEAVFIVRDSTREADILFSLPQFPCSTLRQVKMGCCMDAQQLALLCKCAQQLERLDCYLAGSPTSISNTVDLGSDVFPSLMSLALKTVNIPGRVQIRTDHIPKILAAFPFLEEFCYWDMSRAVSELSTDHMPKRVKKIRIIGGRGIGLMKIALGNLTAFELRDLPNLRSLQILNNSYLASHVEELWFESVPKIRPDILSLFHPSASKLRSLTLSSPQFEARDVEYFLRECRNLEYLNVNNLRYVNDATLLLCQKFKRLERVHVDNCLGITGGGIIRFVSLLRGRRRRGRLAFISARGNDGLNRITVDRAKCYKVTLEI